MNQQFQELVPSSTFIYVNVMLQSWNVFPDLLFLHKNYLDLCIPTSACVAG